MGQPSRPGHPDLARLLPEHAGGARPLRRHHQGIPRPGRRAVLGDEPVRGGGRPAADGARPRTLHAGRRRREHRPLLPAGARRPAVARLPRHPALRAEPDLARGEPRALRAVRHHLRPARARRPPQGPVRSRDVLVVGGLRPQVVPGLLHRGAGVPPLAGRRAAHALDPDRAGLRRRHRRHQRAVRDRGLARGDDLQLARPVPLPCPPAAVLGHPARGRPDLARSPALGAPRRPVVPRPDARRHRGQAVDARRSEGRAHLPGRRRLQPHLLHAVQPLVLPPAHPRRAGRERGAAQRRSSS